jgi:FkbM family methyltransferase
MPGTSVSATIRTFSSSGHFRFRRLPPPAGRTSNVASMKKLRSDHHNAPMKRSGPMPEGEVQATLTILCWIAISCRKHRSHEVPEMKKLIKRAVQKAGYDILSRNRNDMLLQGHLHNVFEKYSIDCVIDVGANVGQYGSFLRNIGFDGWIISFEPISAVHENLVRQAGQDRKWICYQHALGERSETRSMNIFKSTEFSSFLEINAYGSSAFEGVQNARTEDVRIVRLDEILPDIIGKTDARSLYLKLDTQGYDLYAFRGASGALDSIRAIQTELPMIDIYEGMSSPYDILREFNDSGFFVSGMYPVSRDPSLAVIEYDCVLVRR